MLYDVLKVRKAEIKDADRVAEIHTNMWKHGYNAFLPKYFIDSISLEEKKKFRKHLLEDNDPDIHHIVAELKGKILGFGDFGPGKDEDVEKGTGQLYALYVDPSSTGMRVGERLLDTALDQLKKAGFERVTIWVIAQNEAGRRFYEKNGFTSDGTVKPVKDHGVTYDVMRYEHIFSA